MSALKAGHKLDGDESRGEKAGDTQEENTLCDRQCLLPSASTEDALAL